MGWFVLLFACAEPPEPERCDGLDNDQDGFVDEGVFALHYEMPVDEAGAPELDQFFSFLPRTAVGVVELESEYTYSEGSTGFYRKEFGPKGRERFSEEQLSLSTGELQTELSLYEFEQGEPVFERHESWVDDALTSAVETSREYSDDGVLREEVIDNVLGSSGPVTLTYTYDEQGRLIALESRQGSSCQRERWEYRSETMELYFDDRNCDTSEFPARSREWDTDGQLIRLSYYFYSDVPAEVVEWVWEEGAVKTRTTRVSGEEPSESRLYKSHEGGYSRVDLEQDGAFWNLVQNSAGVLSQVEVYLPRFDERAVADLSRRPGTELLERVQISLLDGPFGSAGWVWWELDLDLDAAGNLSSMSYMDHDRGLGLDEEFTYACSGEE